MIYGAPGSGKSFLALDIGLAISSGLGMWHDFKCKKGNTYYLCGEGKEGISKRGKAWELTYTSNIGNFHVTEEAVYITDPTGLKKVEDDIDMLSWKPDIIIIDTLNRHCDKDENSATDMAIWNNACKELSLKYQSFVLVVHHTGISADAQNRARGSSALRGANDCEFSCEKLGNRITVTQRKQKDIELNEPIQLETKTVFLGEDFLDEDGEEQTSLALVKAEFTVADSAFGMLVYLHDKFIRNEDYPKDENGYYKVKTPVLIEFAKSWAREVENKTIDDKQARNKLRESGSIGCVLGENLKSIDRGEWLVKCDGF